MMRVIKTCLSILSIILFIATAVAYKNPNFAEGRSIIVHLFEWKWNDIADECERFLGPNGFGGIQVSPVTENLKLLSMDRPWWERYNPISYKIINRSGNEEEFENMCKRCNAVGVRIFADVVINQMAGEWEEFEGTNGSIAIFNEWKFPSVPYTRKDFHDPCEIEDVIDPDYRKCRIFGMLDLDQSTEYVRGKILNLMNRLINFGVAGFRIDAAKRMYPNDLKEIYKRLNNLNVDHGFKSNARPYIYQEVPDLGNESVSKDEYTPLGVVTEFLFGIELGKTIREGKLKSLINWGPKWGFIKNGDALVFVDNHENQRDHGFGGDYVFTHKHPMQYKIANAFMLSHPYGEPRIMSSFNFEDIDIGPPMDDNQNIISPSINENGSCGDDWICEHRWPSIYRMVTFRNTVIGTNLVNWWDNGNNQIAYGRGKKGFIVINKESYALEKKLQTSLPEGIYCDIITGGVNDGICIGKKIDINKSGVGLFKIDAFKADNDAILAIHIGMESKL